MPEIAAHPFFYQFGMLHSYSIISCDNVTALVELIYFILVKEPSTHQIIYLQIYIYKLIQSSQICIKLNVKYFYSSGLSL
jgi:hypothetical protein